MAAPAEKAETGAPDLPAASQAAEEKAANAPGQSWHSMLPFPAGSQCMLWHGQTWGTVHAPSVSRTAIACILLTCHDPAHQAFCQLLSFIEESTHSYWQLSCSRRSTRALGDAGASAAEAAGRGEADIGPQGPHSHPRAGP